MPLQILIWDTDEEKPASSSKILLWQELSESKNSISIPNLVEKNSDQLKKIYLSWIYGLGNSEINHKRLIDQLVMPNKLSYWWMTLPLEKFTYSSLYINDAIKLIAFDNWAKSKKIYNINLVSANKELADCIALWCKGLNIPFNFELKKKRNVHPFTKKFFSLLPLFFQGISKLLLYFLDRWPLRGAGIKEWKKTKAQTTFCSYFFNIESNGIKKQTYKSSFWANLPKIFNSKPKKTNWLHIYVKSKSIPNARIASKLISQFNLNSKGLQAHATLDSFLSLKIFFKILLGWFHLIRIRIQIGELPLLLINNRLNLTPLLRSDWDKSFFGSKAIENLIYIYLFEAAIKSLPKQDVGLYLFEQQAWEKAFIQFWKSLGHGRLIGVQHSTVLYWDLRYFFDKRTFNKSQNSMPMPDNISVSGPLSMNALLNSGYSKDILLELEALRYLHLISYKKKALRVKKKSCRLLVLGDFLIENTDRQLQLLVDAYPRLKNTFEITFKPHPYCSIDVKKYRILNLNISHDPLKKLFNNCDVVYSSTSTSASAEAYILGIPVITFIDSLNLNLSPLRSLPGVSFVNSSEDLLRTLFASKKYKFSSKWANKIFLLDSDIPRWKRLLI
jgi:surface carbohydrate biosynthesis protein (TIGR04326 family)